jgi:DNA-binding response OmpR family regulator
MPSKGRVLVIDDEKLIVKTTCILLRHLGYETLEAYSGETGLAMAREGNPTLILLDLVMPGMEGWEVLRRLRANAELARVPVVIFTAKEYANADVVGGLEGASGHIGKPFEPEDLEDVLRKIEGERG